MVQAEEVEKTPGHGVLGRYQTCSEEWIKVLSDAIERHHPLQYTPSLLYPDGCQDGNWRNLCEKVYASSWPLPKISSKDKWMKELGSEVAGHGDSSQQTQPKTPNPIVRTGRLVETEQTSRSSAQEIDTRFSLGCESTNLSVERSDKGKDADENVDADRVRTERPVGSEYSFDMFTQREEIDIDFRVSGLPRAVVKQAENFRVRELVKKIESHPLDKRFNTTCNKVSLQPI